MDRLSELKFINEAIFVKKLATCSPMIRRGQKAESFFSGIMSDISSKFKGLESAEEVLDLLAPGILWSFSPTIAIAYEIAEALGFDMGAFFHQVREGLSDFVHGLFNGKGGNPKIIDKVVEEAAQNSFDNDPDVEKLQTLVKTQSGRNIKNQLIVLARGRFNDSMLSRITNSIKDELEGSHGSMFKNGITGFLIKIFSFAIKSIFISLGFFVLGAAAKRLLGKNPSSSSDDVKPVSDTEGEGEAQNNEKESQEEIKPVGTKKDTKKVSLVINPHLDSSLLSTTYNDMDHVWMLHQSISGIKDQLIEWVETIYPQLQNANFEESSAFNRTLSLFQDRNKNTSNLQIMAVPQPFTSIKQIIDSFAADVAAHQE